MKITTTIIGTCEENKLFIETFVAGLESRRKLNYLNGVEWRQLTVKVSPVRAGILGHDAQVLTLTDED